MQFQSLALCECGVWQNAQFCSRMMSRLKLPSFFIIKPADQANCKAYGQTLNLGDEPAQKTLDTEPGGNYKFAGPGPGRGKRPPRASSPAAAPVASAAQPPTVARRRPC